MNRIKDARKKVSKNQKYIALSLKVSGPTVSDWENGKMMPSIPNAIRLAKLLNTSVEYLFDEEYDLTEEENSRNSSPDADPAEPQPSGNQELTSDEQKLLSDYRSMNRQGKEYILQTMSMAVKIYEKDAGISDMEVVSK